MFRCLLFILLMPMGAQAYDWQEGEHIPKEGLQNPLQLSKEELKSYNRAGRYHALNYPVKVTGALVPYFPVKNMLNGETDGFLIDFIEAALKKLSPFKSFDHFLAWMGLSKYPEKEGEGPYFIPFSPDERLSSNWLPDRAGLTIMRDKNGATGLTFSCAACHSSQLFGKLVIGLQTRFPRANRVYVLGDRTLRAIPTPIFQGTAKASKAEAKMYRRTRKNMKYVESRTPRTLGLDTSLAHTALSLSHRLKDEVATKNPVRSVFPRSERLRRTPGDSKPGTWWNVKYKNKWLLDGSVVAGNPIFTNILWNEIGRGTDLNALEAWLVNNKQVVDELTAAVYNTEAPHITDFFPASKINLEAARRGQRIYKKLSCDKCHGNYIKAWDLPLAQTLPLNKQLKTYQVQYFEDTPVKDVGTDPLRYQASTSLEQLNDLKISKLNGAKIVVQKGYVPPPLVGIWARWPYFHNNSVPSLCAVLTPENQRPTKYWAGEPIEKDRDFDWECNGYPVGLNTPRHWREGKGSLYDTRKKAMSNKGHSDRILVKDGKLRFTPKERDDLIRFLQTL